MIPLDYGRSFVIGKAPENEVRLWVESRTRIIDEREGRTVDYVQCASCKSEDTFAERELFYEDNYDFMPIFGPEYALVFRRKAWLNPDYREYRRVEDLWGGQEYHLIEFDSARELSSPAEILQGTYEWSPIVAQTEFANSETGLRAIIEYPVKTMNTIRQSSTYQVDTGPVAWPDLGQRGKRFIDTLSLAFVAFNAPHFADFVIEEPTGAEAAMATEGVQVYHYSRRVSLAATNRLYAIA